MATMISTKSFDYYHTKHRVPAMGWTENIYVDYEGAVRAMRFVKIEFTLENITDGYTYLKTPKPIYYVKIAGIGEVSFEGDNIGWFPLKVRYNADEFTNGGRSGLDFFNNADVFETMEWMADCFGISPESLGVITRYHVSNGSAVKINRYKWDGVKPIAVYISVPDKVFYSQKRGWYFEDECSLPTDTFATSDECKKSNSVKVVDFTDEDDDADVEKGLRKQIRTEVMRSFCNWLTASDIESVAESIVDECVEDVKVCSDYPHYNDSDVRLAIQRVVIGRVIGE